MIRLRATSFALSLSFATLSIGLTACGGDGAGPEETQARLRATIPQVTQASDNALALLDEMPAMDWMNESLDAASVSFASLPIEFPSLSGEDGEDGGAFVAAISKTFVDGEDGEEIEALIALIFNEQNYEGDGYYRLSGAALCGESSDTGVDAECAAEFDSLEIRFRAVLAGDGLDISLAVGPERAEPLVLELRSNRIALVIDLGEGKKAITHLAKLTGEEVELPRVMEGSLAFELEDSRRARRVDQVRYSRGRPNRSRHPRG